MKQLFAPKKYENKIIQFIPQMWFKQIVLLMSNFKRRIKIFWFIPLLLLAGCPVGTDYPLGMPGEEKIDKNLLGTWTATDNTSYVKKVKIEKADEYSYNVEVLDTGENYWVNDTKFKGYVTQIEDKQFVYFKGITDGKYYLYCYNKKNKKTIETYDVGLKVDGIKAVTSIPAFREEVKKSLKKEDCLIEKIVWKKEK